MIEQIQQNEVRRQQREKENLLLREKRMVRELGLFADIKPLIRLFATGEFNPPPNFSLAGAGEADGARIRAPRGH
eukprot:4692413-Pyramimonas_sp.AAC.1